MLKTRKLSFIAAVVLMLGALAGSPAPSAAGYYDHPWGCALDVVPECNPLEISCCCDHKFMCATSQSQCYWFCVD